MRARKIVYLKDLSRSFSHPSGTRCKCSLLAVLRNSRIYPSPSVLKREGLGVKGKGRMETPNPFDFTKPLTPGSSPLYSGKRGVARATEFSTPKVIRGAVDAATPVQNASWICVRTIQPSTPAM